MIGWKLFKKSKDKLIKTM